jgi:hypothetical protein
MRVVAGCRIVAFLAFIRSPKLPVLFVLSAIAVVHRCNRFNVVENLLEIIRFVFYLNNPIFALLDLSHGYDNSNE